MKTVYNFAAFYAGWFACALGAAYGFPLAGPSVVTVLLALHLFFLSSKPGREMVLIVSAGLIGTGSDSLLMSNGLYAFPDHPPSGLCPIWMTTLWMIFASTFDHALSWLHKRYMLAILFGATGGPLSYLAGERLGALTLPEDATLSLVMLAIVWGALMPALLRLTDLLLNAPRSSAAAVSALAAWLFLALPVVEANQKGEDFGSAGEEILMMSIKEDAVQVFPNKTVGKHLHSCSCIESNLKQIMLSGAQAHWLRDTPPSSPSEV